MPEEDDNSTTARGTSAVAKRPRFRSAFIIQHSSFSTPSPDLLHDQAAWLAPARARLLRRVQIAQRRRVLELGCGIGAVTGELVRRAAGRVVALDRHLEALAEPAAGGEGAARVCGDAMRLPFGAGAFDLVFSQFTLLWLDPQAAVDEAYRVLEPGGGLVALEPDYGGLIEYPLTIATRTIWINALLRAGAEPEIGRKLPGLLATAGFKVQVDLLDQLETPSPRRFDFLRGLPLGSEERALLDQIQAADRAMGEAVRVAHLPVFLVTATK